MTDLHEVRSTRAARVAIGLGVADAGHDTARGGVTGGTGGKTGVGCGVGDVVLPEQVRTPAVYCLSAPSGA